MTSRASICAALAAVLLVLSGCSGTQTVVAPAASATVAPAASATSAPSQTAGSTKPTAKAMVCDLLTGEDAARTLGVPGPLRPRTDTASECTYESANAVDRVELTVEREAYQAGVVDDVLAFLDPAKAAKVDGIGDAALSYSLGTLGTQYHVWAKGRYLVLTVSIISRSVETEQLTHDLALAVVARL